MVPFIGPYPYRTQRCALALLLWASLALLPALSADANAADHADLVAASGKSDPGGPELATSTNRSELFYDGRREVKLRYRVRSEEPATVKIKLVQARTDRVVEQWEHPVESGVTESLTWGGVVDRDLKREARYQFEVIAEGADGGTTRSVDEDDRSRDSFHFRHHRFPIRGPHSYTLGGGEFGAPRGDRSHQGQDVGAACGTRLVAARGGKVQWNRYQDAAGYYLVIDGRKTGVDYVYMHMQRRSPREEGERVRTGQRLGRVGATGNATGCILHFELWTSPGWYEGGKPFDPLPELRSWDHYS